MAKRFGFLSLVALVVIAFSTPGSADEAKGASKGVRAKAAGGKAVIHAVEELKWQDQPGVPVKMAVLWGDSAKGAHGALHKFPAGFTAPMHHHTANHNAVVVSGTAFLTPEGEAERKLSPGSHFSFTGKKKHATRCDAAAECMIFVDCAGPWDVVMPDAKKAETKK